MAHECPDCGQVCYCNGDIDDIELSGGEDECIHFLLSEQCSAYDHCAKCENKDNEDRCWEIGCSVITGE